MPKFIIFSFSLVAGPGFAAADPGCYSSALLRAQTARVYVLTRLSYHSLTATAMSYRGLTAVSRSLLDLGWIPRSSRGMTGISAESLPRKPAQRGGNFAMVSPFRDPRARDVIP